MEMIAVYVTGGLLYGLIELLWRGWTHWSMLLCGGACFALMYQISLSALSFPWKCLLSACVITAVEFVTGCLVNIILKWQVWDYSSLPGNLWGQICPQFFLMWLLLSDMLIYTILAMLTVAVLAVLFGMSGISRRITKRWK